MAAKQSKEKDTQKKQKRGIFKNLRAEFRKIKWPDKKTVVKQTIAVLTSAVVVGFLIALVDFLIELGLGAVI